MLAADHPKEHDEPCIANRALQKDDERTQRGRKKMRNKRENALNRLKTHIQLYRLQKRKISKN